MKGLLFIVVLLSVFAIASSTTCYSSGECLSNTVYYDYIQYVSRWPSAYTTAPYPPYVDSFVLHGLWPTFADNDYPCTCTNEQFDFTQVEDLYPGLEVAWYDFDGWNSTDLWSHEWDKHGTCATNNGNSKLQTQHDFFNLGIQWHQQMNTTDALAKAGIVPSSTTAYSSSSIYHAIQSYFGVAPLIQCTSLNGKTVLYLVSFCFTNDTLELTECGDCITQQWDNDEGCGSTTDVYLLPFNFITPFPPTGDVSALNSNSNSDPQPQENSQNNNNDHHNHNDDSDNHNKSNNSDDHHKHSENHH